MTDSVIESVRKRTRWVSVDTYTKAGEEWVWCVAGDQVGANTIEQMFVKHDHKTGHEHVLQILESELGLRIDREKPWHVTTSGQVQYRCKGDHEQ